MPNRSERGGISANVASLNVCTHPRVKTVLLKAPGFLGDEVVFTGVVRELKLETGWNFRIATRRQELWWHNPSIGGFDANGDEDIIVQHDHCPPYYAAGQTPLHFLERYLGDVRRALGLSDAYRISKFAGDVRPSPEEMLAPPFELPPRYWVIVAGWKTGVPTKAWPIANYQQVVDALRGRVSFVQTGVRASWHPPLRGVRNTVGLTDIRRLISLIHHAEGVVCPITSIMHLAAAVPTSARSGFALRPCVVVGGGREAPHYITYPMHRVLNVVGQLDCCSTGGCGKSRFGAGQCPYPVQFAGSEVPKCMTLIKPDDVVRTIEFYYRGAVSLPRRLTVVEALLKRLGGETSKTAILHGVEIGAGQGEVSSQILRACEDLHLTMVDAWQQRIRDPLYPAYFRRSRPYFGRLMASALAATEFAANRRNLTSSLDKAAATIQDGTLEFVFFNTLQWHPSLAFELERWHRKLKPCGYLGGDRYLNGSQDGVGHAVDEFARRHGWSVEKDKGDTWFIKAGTK